MNWIPWLHFVASRWHGKINSTVFCTEKNIPSSKNLWPVTQNWLSSNSPLSSRDTCRERLKYQEIFIPLSYLYLYSLLVCPAKSVCSVACVFVRLPGFSFSFLPSLSALPMSSQAATKHSLHPSPGEGSLLSLVFLSWTNTCITWLASWKNIFPLKPNTCT